MTALTPCMGGFCLIRASCANYQRGGEQEPAERLCERGQDGVCDGFAVVVRRAVNEWPRISNPALLRPADVFDGLTA